MKSWDPNIKRCFLKITCSFEKMTRICELLENHPAVKYILYEDFSMGDLDNPDTCAEYSMYTEYNEAITMEWYCSSMEARTILVKKGAFISWDRKTWYPGVEYAGNSTGKNN